VTCGIGTTQRLGEDIETETTEKVTPLQSDRRKERSRRAQTRGRCRDEVARTGDELAAADVPIRDKRAAPHAAAAEADASITATLCVLCRAENQGAVKKVDERPADFDEPPDSRAIHCRVRWRRAS